MRSNYDDYVGMLQTSPVRMLGMPREESSRPTPPGGRLSSRRPAAQRAAPGSACRFMMPLVPKEVGLELTRPEAIRADELWQASLRLLEPFQMLILILSKDGAEADPYSRQGQFQAMAPLSADREDVQAFDRLRLTTDWSCRWRADSFPLVASLTWTTLSPSSGMECPPSVSARHSSKPCSTGSTGEQLILMGGARLARSRTSRIASSLRISPPPSRERATSSTRRISNPGPDAFRPVIPFAIREDPIAAPTDVSDIPGRQHSYQAPVPIHPASEPTGVPCGTSTETRCLDDPPGRIERADSSEWNSAWVGDGS